MGKCGNLHLRMRRRLPPRAVFEHPKAFESPSSPILAVEHGKQFIAIINVCRMIVVEEKAVNVALNYQCQATRFLPKNGIHAENTNQFFFLYNQRLSLLKLLRSNFPI